MDLYKSAVSEQGMNTMMEAYSSVVGSETYSACKRKLNSLYETETKMMELQVRIQCVWLC